MLNMRRRFVSPWAAVCGLTAIATLADVDRYAAAQVVQLPSMQTFGYSGSVTVPDSGQAHLGGVGRQRSGSASMGGGPLAGRSFSNASGGTAISASASIIDLQAMDAAILNQPTATAASQPANYRTRDAGAPVINTLTPQLNARRMGADQLPPPNDPNAWEIALGGGSVSKLGPANTIVRDNSDVRYFMQRAKEATNAGRSAAALVYYRLAYERLTPEQRERVHQFQAKASAEAKGGQVTATQAAAAAQAATAPAAPATAPASPAASSEAGAVPPAGDDNANPFASPF